MRTSGMRAQADVTQTSTTGQQKRKDHACKLKQRPKTTAVLACTTGTSTLPLAEARTEGIVDVSPQHRTRGAFELTRICWTLKPIQRVGNAFQLTRNSWTLCNQKTSVAMCVATSQRLAVPTEQTTADDRTRPSKRARVYPFHGMLDRMHQRQRDRK